MTVRLKDGENERWEGGRTRGLGDGKTEGLGCLGRLGRMGR